jgi:hypothetical protein
VRFRAVSKGSVTICSTIFIWITYKILVHTSYLTHCFSIIETNGNDMDRTNLWRRLQTPANLIFKFTPFYIFIQPGNGLLKAETCSWCFKSKYKLFVRDIFTILSIHPSRICSNCLLTCWALVVSNCATPCTERWNYYKTQRPQLERWTVETISCCARLDGVSKVCFGVRGFWHYCLMRVMCKWYLIIVIGLSFGLLIGSTFSLFKVKSTSQTR